MLAVLGLCVQMALPGLDPAFASAVPWTQLGSDDALCGGSTPKGTAETGGPVGHDGDHKAGCNGCCLLVCAGGAATGILPASIVYPPAPGVVPPQPPQLASAAAPGHASFHKLARAPPADGPGMAVPPPTLQLGPRLPHLP
jgi:hypothetical protein